MKKQFLTLLLAAAFIAVGTAQTSVFHVAPAQIDTFSDEEDAPAHGEITNMTGNTINLRWERKVIEITPGCETAVCDPNTCYARHIGVRNLSMDPNEQGELTVHFYRNGNYCEGIVHLTVRNLDNPSDSTVVVYTLNQATGATELPAAEVKLFPNPFVEYFSLENADDVAAIRVYTLDGRQVSRLEVNAYNIYSLYQQPTGVYIIALEDKNGKVFQAMEVKKQ